MATFLNIDYQTWWLIATAALLLAYGILDGFDLGAGAWHLFLKNEDERQLAMKSIAPVWDGNEVFLVIGGGALFAGFPEVYATLFSAMYIPFMLFLVFLISRAVSIEFRNKENAAWWKKTWDIAYGVASAVLPVLLGVVIANVLQGMPLDADFEFVGSWLSFLNPYAIVIGLMALSFSMVHGAAYLLLKTEDEMQKRVHFLLKKAVPIFILLFAVSVVWSIAKLAPETPKTMIYIILILIIGVIGLVVWSIQKKKFNITFISSSVAMLLAGLLALVKHFPMMIPSTIDPANNSITIYNGCASQKSLETMLIIACIGVPLIVGYVTFAYRVFWGKVRKEDKGY